MAERCAACHAYGWHTEDCPVAKRETARTDHVPSPTTWEPSTDDPRDWSTGEAYDKGYGAGRREAAAAPQARVRALETALRNLRMDVWHADYCAVGDGHCICGLTAAIVEADRVLAAEQPTTERDGGLDVDRLARALCASRDPIILASDDQFVDDECRTLGRSVAAEYARLIAASPATPADPEPIGPVRIRSANCGAGDHVDCLGMVEQDIPDLGITDCLCQCHDLAPADPETAE